MAQGIVVMQVDGDDVTVLGVAPDVTRARELALADALEYSESEDGYDVKGWIDQFDENLLAASNLAPLGDGLDTQFESGVGSWDYRFVRTEVNL